MSDFKDKLLSALKDKTIVLIVLVLGVVGKQVWDYVQKGAQVDVDNHIEEIVVKSLQKDEVVRILLQNPNVVRMILESDEVKEFTEQAGQDIHDKIVEDVTRSDTNKVSMRSFVGMEAGVRDEQVLPILAKIVKAWNEGEITTNKQLEEYVDREIRTARF